MSVQYEPQLSCWSFSCLFGCVQYGYETEDAARVAFLGHSCHG